MKAKDQLLSDDFEVRGSWGIPGTNHIVPGILYYSNEKVRLELFGKLRPDGDPINSEWKPIDVIQGVTEGGERFTLFSAVLTNFKTHLGMGAFSQETYEGFQFLVGQHIENLEKIRFESMNVELTYLPEWFGIPSLHTNANEYSINAKVTELFEIEIPSIDAVIKSSGAFKFSTDSYRKAEILSSSSLKLIPSDVKSFDWFEEQLFSIQQLMTILTGQSIYVESVNFVEQVELITSDVVENYKAREQYRFFFRQGPLRKLNNPREDQFLIPYKHIAQNFDLILNNWFEKKENLDVVFELFTGEFFKITHLTTSFSNFMQAIEAFHRKNYEGKLIDAKEFERIESELNSFIDQFVPRALKDKLKGSVKYGNEFTLKKRLVELSDTLSLESKTLIFGSDKKVNKFLQKLVSTRNYLTHYDESGKSNIIDIDDRFYAIQRLKVFIALLLLKELGIPENLILNNIKENNQLHYHLEKAKKIF